MKPYYDRDGIQIFLGDCLEIMPQLDRKFDLILTDPPYGIGIASNPFRQKYIKSEWDNVPASPELIQKCISMGTNQIIWGGNYFNLPPTQRFLIWDKKQPESFSSAMCEMAWTSLEGPAKIYREWVVGIDKFHPTTKPTGLFKWCISFVPETVTILDPFLGSGTTLVAAAELHRQAVGIEIEERYVEIAAKRIERVLNQGELFT